MSKKIILKENMESGSRLKRIRENRRLTQEAFADELGISVSAYKKLESGENGISTKRLRQLKTMDISSDFILYGDRGHIEKLKFDVDNGSEIDKIGIMLQFILELIRDSEKGGNVEKEQIMELVSNIFDEG
ncbi:MAG: helix-turn-helix transcriptional regulator [Lachnospiraceae bacterium]|nr:helix-turn-helix transcriptional regulator [Lachnospiraceae bacterium]